MRRNGEEILDQMEKASMNNHDRKTNKSKKYSWTVVVALVLMSVSTLQALAATLSKENGVYPYKVIGATLMSEVFKLTASFALLLIEVSGDSVNLRLALHATKRSVIMAAVPGISYQILNNLNFVTLYYVDAPTFQILGNLKIVATGLAGWLLLGRTLSKGKWLALTLLTIGAATSQLASSASTPTSSTTPKGTEIFGYISAITCVFLSATMGVFTEMYMKGNRASIHFQNLQLYFFGIIANLFALLLRDEIGPKASTSLLNGFNFWAWITVLTNGSCGLAVSFLLRYADSIAKTYSSCLAIPCTSIASFLFLSTPIGAPNILGSGVMLISLAYYYFGDSLFLSTSSPTSTTADRAQAIVSAKPISSHTSPPSQSSAQHDSTTSRASHQKNTHPSITGTPPVIEPSSNSNGAATT